MSSKIDVGDRVRSICHDSGTVLALHTAEDGKEWAWVQWHDEYYECFGVKLSDLTRIEPETVTLRPRYGVGERVNFIGQGKVQLAGVEVGYHIEKWGGLWPESLLEPVPTPCPTCKGSGKSE